MKMKMNKTHIVSLSAAKISAAQRKDVQAAKAKLETAMEVVEEDSAKVTQLREKEEKLRKEALSLQRDAASFHSDAELKLIANQKTLERLRDAIHQAESECFDDKVPLFSAIDQAQSVISKLSQATYNALLDQIGALLAPYYSNFLTARWVGRDTHATRDLTSKLLQNRVNSADSIQRLYEYSKDVIRKLNSLLDGGEIWSFEGAKVPPSESDEAAA